jgi:hypothetical protein
MGKGSVFIRALILVIGTVLGDLIAKLTANISFLSWLSFGRTIGLSAATLDLGILSVTFGFSVSLTLAAIIGLIAAIIICRII